MATVLSMRGVIMQRTTLPFALALFVALTACDGSGGAESACTDASTSEACAVFRLVNQERAAAGLAPYEWNADLAVAAQLHAIDMADNGYFDHVSLDGRTFSARARDAGYDGSPRGENIALGQRSAEQAMSSWMASGGHRANILSNGSTEIGVGYYERHWVQVFGAR